MVLPINLNGGENIKLTKKSFIFIVFLTILIISMGSVSANNLNDTSVDFNRFSTNFTDDNIEAVNLDIDGIYYYDTIEIANSGGINVNVKDSYVANSNTWEEDGIAASNAKVSVYDSANSLVYQGFTNNNGNLAINQLNQGKYNIKIALDTYEEYSQSITLGSSAVNVNHVFYPDILFFVDYTSHHEKLLELLNISKRVCYVSTTNYDATKEWLFEYANFIQLDMYADIATYTFDINILKDSPAYKNYNIAYTFGVYDKSLIDAIDLHYVGGSPGNNDVNSVENTYVGSYFQAEDIQDSSVLKRNMYNLVDYIKYLINPKTYKNPTLDKTRTPLVASTMGIYHPDFGSLTVSPSQEQVNSWILKNPGYNDDGIGSLNWMTGEYKEWNKVNVNLKSLYQQFEKWYKANKKFDKSFIVVASYYSGGPLIDSLIRTYEANGRPSFNIFQSITSPSMSSLLSDVKSVTTIGISAITSLYSWSLDYNNMANNGAKNDLTDLDLTLLKAVNDISESSYKSELGPQMEWTYAVTIPSFEGVFGAVVTSYIDSLGKTVVIQSGVEKIVKMSIGWADLKDKGNYDKRVTILLYNYPPGKAEIGASYLDVFQSTYDLLLSLYDEGYNLGMSKEELPSLRELTDLIVEFGNKGTWAQGLLNQYVEKYWDQLMANNQLISLEQFENLTKDLNPKLLAEMINKWGDGLGNIMVYNNTYIVIPGMQLGNVFISFQPSRGWEEIQNYHDTTLPAHQQYVAFYEWLDKAHKTDAIIYMGTHGTLEFMPGHQIGVQDGDWTFELTLTPSIYVYIVSNPGEAMVARDRLGALMITHMTPAIVSSELYGDYRNLSTAIDNYKNSIKLNVSENSAIYKEEILKLADKLGFDRPNADETFEKWLDDLHNFLDEMENDFNALGLHTIGKVLEGQELIEEVITIITSQTTIYNDIFRLLFPTSDKIYYNDIKGNLLYTSMDNLTKAFLYSYIAALVNGSTVEELNSKWGINKNTSLYEDTEYIQKIIEDIRANNEWNAIFKALNGSYVPAGLFADPAYGSSIPTGYNGYATDSTKIPSRVAFQASKKIVDLLLVNYYEKNGKWPEMVALILWGTEILRTEGIGIGEYLYLLGCEPVWSKSGAVTGVTMLPLKDLTVTLSNGKTVNRPRIDVYASIVTSNIDWIRWMVTATNLAAFAEGEDASNNYVIKHYAENPTLDRLFGLPGNVLEGTGMSTLIPNTADWDIKDVNDKLAEIYMDRVSYSWNLDSNGKIVISQQKDNYKYLLGKTDLITQNFDSTWRLFDSDDYYDWFGGLLNAAQYYNAKPDTAFVDIRNKNNYVVRDYQEEIEFEIRSVLTNTKFLDALGKTTSGMNSWASKLQNMYGSLIVSKGSLGKGIGDQLAKSVMYMNQNVNDVGSAAAWQSSSAWMMYLAKQGLWQADSSTLSELANQMIQHAIDYGVACCHHTCKNLDFNKWVLQVSTLSADQKSEYAKVLAQATLTDPLYENDDSQGSNSSQGGDSGDVVDDAKGEVVGNGSKTNNQQSSGSSASNGASVGDSSLDQSATNSELNSQNSDSGQDSSTGESSSDSSSEDQSGQAYDISKKSSSKSASAESSMPATFIAVVIGLILLFVVGYRKKMA